jgi:hypothetical protein
MKFGMRFLFLFAVAGLIVFQPSFTARAQDEDEEPDYSVRLDAATTARLGIEVATLKAAEFRGEAGGFGVILPFDGLAQTDADLATAEAAVEASRASAEASKVALDRAQGLFNANVSVSRQTVEAAQRQLGADLRQAAADTAQLNLARRKAVAQWGQSLPLTDRAERTALLARLGTGDTALARITFSNGTIGDTTPASVKIERIAAASGAASWTTNRVWSAPADPTVPGRSFYCLIDRARGLLPGERVLVSIPMGKMQQGVIIPSDAVLIAEGMGWYYDRETVMPVIPLAPFFIFNRRKLDLSQPTSDGYFVAGGDSKAVVVVEGAGLILARETGASDDED